MHKIDTIEYSERFQDTSAVTAYESNEYGVQSYSSQIWQWERPVVERVIAEFRRGRPGPVRLLDFACGTGRVLSAVEGLVDSAEGIDISENMVAVARTKCRRARFKVGDILARPELLEKNYDVITAFRFLLNVEPAVRARVLRQLRAVLRAPDGLLVVNIHGNSRSLRHPAVVWRRWRERSHPTGAMLNEMSPGETERLLRECGFHIVSRFGFGLLPPTAYRTPFRRWAAMADHFFSGENRWSRCSIDMMITCRPA